MSTCLRVRPTLPPWAEAARLDVTPGPRVDYTLHPDGTMVAECKCGCGGRVERLAEPGVYRRMPDAVEVHVHGVRPDRATIGYRPGWLAE